VLEALVHSESVLKQGNHLKINKGDKKMTKQLIKMMMLVLAIGLTASAATAQVKNNGGFAPVGFYAGIETADGTLDQISAIRYGNNFVLNSFGEWETYHLMVSLDYTTNQIVPNNFIVTGGSWSLAIVRDNQYAGTLYGDVQTGSVNLTTNDNGETVSKQMQVNLRSIGGFGIFAGRAGKNISGAYNATTDLRSKETRGTTNFGF
jgi:hypothetical protein